MRIVQTMPLWIRIVSGLMALLGMFVGISLYISPDAFMPDIDFRANGADYLAQMWAARQIAIASVIAFSVVCNSVPMFLVSQLAYSIMNGQDIVIGLLRQDQGLAGGAGFFFLLSLIMMMALFKKKA